MSPNAVKCHEVMVLLLTLAMMSQRLQKRTDECDNVSLVFGLELDSNVN